MKPDDISNALNSLDEELISEADGIRTKKSRLKFNIIKTVAAVACVALVVTLWTVLTPPDAPNPPTVIPVYGVGIEAEYPETVPFPDASNNDTPSGYDAYSAAYDKWFEARQKVRNMTSGYTESLAPFYQQTMSEILSNNNGENKVYSPLNVYMALSMLAETTEGESRKQILDLLGVTDIEALRTKANKMWLANYADDGATKSILANSMWLSDTVRYNQNTLKNIADNYYASSYLGDVGSDGFEKALQDWLDKQTGGLLGDAVKNVEMSDDTLMMLASTVYFNARWQDEFFEDKTKTDTFHSPKGDVKCEFMNTGDLSHVYFGEGFLAHKKPFVNNMAMRFILPDEDVSIDSLIKSDKLSDLFYSYEDKTRYCSITLSVPKFDVSYNTDLKENLMNLGIENVFSAEKSEFSLLEGEAPIALGKVDHAARVTIDEKGCVAAAFTVESLCGSAMPIEKVDFVLDRPFIFAITSEAGAPLFIGIVNQP